MQKKTWSLKQSDNLKQEKKLTQEILIKTFDQMIFFLKSRSCKTSLFEEGTSNLIHNSIRINVVERKLMRFCIVIDRKIEQLP